MVFRNAGFSMNLQSNKFVRLHLPRHVINDMKTLCCFEIRLLIYLDRHELTLHATVFAVKSTKLQDVWHSTTPLLLNSGLRYHESPTLVLRIYPVPFRRTTRDRYGYPRCPLSLGNSGINLLLVRDWDHPEGHWYINHTYLLDTVNITLRTQHTP